MDVMSEHSEVPCFSQQMTDALFFSMAVYQPTPETVLSDLHTRFGTVTSVMEFGFGEEGKQAIFAGRTSKGRIIVACRGTAGLKDVLQDLKYFHTHLAYARGAAHWGFAERAQSVPIDYFCKLLSAGEEIVFTGHSLGGAVASLLSLRVLEHTKGSFQHQVHCITFGSPLFASDSLAQTINSKYKHVFLHVVSKRDVIPKILPVVSALQRLLYAGEDHLEGLSVIRKLLECIKWLPVVPFIKGVERKIPSLVKLLIRCLMKLASPSHVTGSYAFAGHVLMLDSDATIESSLKLSSADDLNNWHSQLNFALGAGFDPSMIEEHGLNRYKDGILRAFSHVVINREVSSCGGDCICVESTSILSNGSSQRTFEDEGQQKKILIRLTSKGDVGKDACELLLQCTMDNEVAAKGLLSRGSLKDIDVWRNDGDGSQEILKYFQMMESSCGELCALSSNSGLKRVDVTKVCHYGAFMCKGGSVACSSGEITVAGQSKEGFAYSEYRKTSSSHMNHGKSKAHLEETQILEGSEGYGGMSLCVGEGNGSSLSIKNLTHAMAAGERSGPHSLEKGGSGKLPGVDGRSLMRSRSGSSNSSQWPLIPREDQVAVPGHALCCQTCSSLEVCKLLNRQTAITSVSKAIVRRYGHKRYKFGWFLGTIGRVARHLRVLDNMCILTFIKIALSNFLG